MDLDKYSHTESLTVNAAPEVVYDLVADITRIGEFSPVCKSAQWTDDALTMFTGDNVLPERQWTTHCRVDVAERGKEFTYTNRGPTDGHDLVRWSYTVAPADAGTELTEHWQVLPGYGEFMNTMAPDMDVEGYLDSIVARTHAGMAETLANVKATAEH